MSLEFSVESIKDAWNDFYCLAVDHRHEYGGSWVGLSYDHHVKQEEDGELLLCVARFNGEMVGYAVIGEDAAHFILPKYRNSESKFLGYAEDQSEARRM